MTRAPNRDDLVELCLHFARQEGFIQTPLKNLQIVRSNAKSEPMHTVYTPSLCFIVQGEKDAIIASKKYHYSPTQFLVSSIDMPVTGQVTVASEKKPYLCLVLGLESEIVYDIISSEPNPVSAIGPVQRGYYVDTVTPEIMDSFVRLLRSLQNESDRRILSRSIVREITYRLLCSPYGDVVRQLGIIGSQTQRISKVIEVIKKDFASSLRIEELARIANMSPSSFHEHFKKVTAMSPLQFQKRIRLQEARRLLSLDVGDAASVSYQVGYESPSQFSREYARLFGLPPIADLKRLRQSS